MFGPCTVYSPEWLTCLFPAQLRMAHMIGPLHSSGWLTWLVPWTAQHGSHDWPTAQLSMAHMIGPLHSPAWLTWLVPCTAQHGSHDWSRAQPSMAHMIGPLHSPALFTWLVHFTAQHGSHDWSTAQPSMAHMIGPLPSMAHMSPDIACYHIWWSLYSSLYTGMASTASWAEKLPPFRVGDHPLHLHTLLKNVTCCCSYLLQIYNKTYFHYFYTLYCTLSQQ